MRVHDCNWMQLEDYLRRDDRIVLPLGSTEQHGYLSLGTDNILAERVAVEAAEPVGVPVLPVLAYGITPGFAAYPGSPTLRAETYLRVVGDLLESLYGQGFRRVLIVNGHGGNAPGRAVREEWMLAHEGAQAIWHDLWAGRRAAELTEALGEPDHANWSENFPWTRLAGVELPHERKQLVLREGVRARDAREVRGTLGDGSFGGVYARGDDEMLGLWQLAVEDTRGLLVHGWRD
jgi:creatinine amidohydrolase